MKKLLWRVALAAGTVGAVVAGSAAFSAFEAHVINVTATIENATTMNTTPLTFGDMFPQEIRVMPETISLSSSFLSANNTLATSVDYVIKQKPKCGLPIAQTDGATTTPVAYSAYEQVTENAAGVFSCPDANYVILPLLCPYLSKTSPNSAPTGTDVSVLSFHGATSTPAWTDAVSVATEAVGHLSKNGPTSTTWQIDLHTPCFRGQCAQDWASFVHTANPAADPNAYMADPASEHQQFGCDLWYEVSGINGTSTAPNQIIVPIGASDLDNSSSSPAVVATDGLNKWFMYNDTNDTIDNTLGTFVVGPASPPFGTGSVQFTLAASPFDRKNIATYQFSGTALAAITQMSFGTYSHSGVAGATESPFLNFNVDFTGTSTAFQSRLVYVPSANGAAPQDTWNSNDAINGGNALWTWSKFVANGNKWPDGNPNQYRTWSAIKLAFPAARLLPVGGWLGVRVGEPGPTGYIGNVNFFSIATGGPTTVYEFHN